MLSTTLYGAEAWYTGPTKSSWSLKKQTTVRAGDSKLLKEIDTSLKAAARAVLPVWKTTPIPVLHRESGIPPARVLLDQVRLRQAARIANLDPLHPIVRRIQIKGRYRSRLQTLADLAPKCRRPHILPHQQNWISAGLNLLPLGKDKAAEAHAKLRAQIPRDEIISYSDGSQLNGNTGWGAITYYKSTHRTAIGALDKAEVFDAEITGALAAAQLTARFLETQPTPTAAHYFLDNQAVVSGLLKAPPDRSQDKFLAFRDLAKVAARKGCQTFVSWVPGHKNVEGNEAADALAKKGSELAPRPSKPTFTHLLRINRRQRLGVAERWWHDNTPHSYRDWKLPWLNSPGELQFSQPTLHRLLAERSGHGDFQDYHDRFQHDANPRCRCDEPKNPGHVFQCEQTYHLMPKGAREARDTRAFLLGPVGCVDFQIFVKKALPYEGKDHPGIPQAWDPRILLPDDGPLIIGPGPAHPAPSPPLGEPSPGPTNAGTPGAGITQLMGEPGSQHATSQLATGTLGLEQTLLQGTQLPADRLTNRL